MSTPTVLVLELFEPLQRQREIQNEWLAKKYEKQNGWQKQNGWCIQKVTIPFTNRIRLENRDQWIAPFLAYCHWFMTRLIAMQWHGYRTAIIKFEAVYGLSIMLVHKTCHRIRNSNERLKIWMNWAHQNYSSQQINQMWWSCKILFQIWSSAIVLTCKTHERITHFYSKLLSYRSLRGYYHYFWLQLH